MRIPPASRAKPLNEPGFWWRMISALRRDDTISAPASSWLPSMWSASECVFTSVRIGASAVTAANPSSIRRVSARSASVSITADSPSPTTSPAFDSNHSPFGCIQAWHPAPTSIRPPGYASGLPCGVAMRAG